MLGNMNINPYSRALIAVTLISLLVGVLALLGNAGVLAAVAFALAAVAVLMWILIGAMKWREPVTRQKDPSQRDG